MNKTSNSFSFSFGFLISAFALSQNTYASPCSEYCKQWNENQAGCKAAPLALVKDKKQDAEETKQFVCTPCTWAMITKSSYGVGKTNRCYDSGYVSTKNAVDGSAETATDAPAPTES